MAFTPDAAAAPMKITPTPLTAALAGIVAAVAWLVAAAGTAVLRGAVEL